MSIWIRIREALAQITDNLPLVDYFRGPPEQSVAFTIAIIALSAKMAKADGRVTRDEVRTLRQIFDFDDQDARDIARVFDLARQDVAGFEIYAQRIYKLFKDRPEMLDDIFESLFHIALADGSFHENEEIFLTRVAEIFHTRAYYYEHLKSQYVPGADPDPLQVLGLGAGASHDDIRHAYKAIMRENHPDRLRARGLPEEAVNFAENRVRAANAAYDKLQSQMAT